MKKQFNQFHHAAKQCEFNNSWDLFRSGTKIGAISEDGQMLHLSIVSTNIPFRNTDLEEISSLMKDIQSANRKTTFETGATSAAVNELILYTDNTAKLAAMRDKIYEHIEMCELDKTLKTPSKIIFTNLMDAAEGQYFWEFGNGKESAHIKKISSHQRDEYCHIYANRFADWKRERELQAKQK